MTTRTPTEARPSKDVMIKLKSNIRNLFNCKRVCGICLNNTLNLRLGETVYNIVCGENTSERSLMDIVARIFGYAVTSLLPTCYFCEDCINTILHAYRMLEEIQFNHHILQYYTNKLSEQLNMKLPDDVQSIVFELDYPNRSESCTKFNESGGHITSDNYCDNDVYEKYCKQAPPNIQKIFFKKEPKEVTLEINEIMDKIKDQITVKKLKTAKPDNCTMKKEILINNKKSPNTKPVRKASNTAKPTKKKTEYAVMINKRYYKCYLCDSSFTRERELLKHSRKLCVNPNPSIIDKMIIRNVKHTECEGKEICDQCGKQVASKYLLKHKKLHKYVQKQCPICGQFINKASYNKHMDIHSGQPKMKHCPNCDYKTRFGESLDAHINKVHLNVFPYSCDTCKKSFHSKMLLREHVKIHTRLKTEQCDICGDRFAYKKSLVLHMRLHTGYRPYKCDLCEESFLSASRRQIHKQTKHSGRTFQCDICAKKFFIRTTLRAHMVKVHGKNDRDKNTA